MNVLICCIANAIKNLKRGSSYTDSLDWMKRKKETTNPSNDDGKYFQYATAIAQNHEEIERDPERVSNIKPFIKKCYWK